MHQQEIARMLVKILGLVVVAYALIGLPQDIVLTIGMLGFGRGTGVPSLATAIRMPQFWGMSFAPFVIYVVIGLSLFWWSGRIVDHIVIRTQPNATDSTDYRTFEEIAIAVLGAYFLAEGLADMARWAGAELGDAIRNHRAFGQYIWSAQFGIISGGGMRIIIGVVLTIGSRGFVAFRRLLSSPHSIAT